MDTGGGGYEGKRPGDTRQTPDRWTDGRTDGWRDGTRAVLFFFFFFFFSFGTGLSFRFALCKKKVGQRENDAERARKRPSDPCAHPSPPLDTRLPVFLFLLLFFVFCFFTRADMKRAGKDGAGM
jgi:hypothetical protein